MSDKIAAILYLLYEGALYRYAIEVEHDNPKTPENIFEWWREEEQFWFLTAKLPDHLGDHLIVGVEPIGGII
jgi:hypothetical protein